MQQILMKSVSFPLCLCTYPSHNPTIKSPNHVSYYLIQTAQDFRHAAVSHSQPLFHTRDPISLPGAILPANHKSTGTSNSPTSEPITKRSCLAQKIPPLAPPVCDKKKSPHPQHDAVTKTTSVAWLLQIVLAVPSVMHAKKKK